jgi:hypothetical protein
MSHQLYSLLVTSQSVQCLCSAKLCLLQILFYYRQLCHRACQSLAFVQCWCYLLCIIVYVFICLSTAVEKARVSGKSKTIRVNLTISRAALDSRHRQLDDTQYEASLYKYCQLHTLHDVSPFH